MPKNKFIFGALHFGMSRKYIYILPYLVLIQVVHVNKRINCLLYLSVKYTCIKHYFLPIKIILFILNVLFFNPFVNVNQKM